MAWGGRSRPSSGPMARGSRCCWRWAGRALPPSHRLHASLPASHPLCTTLLQAVAFALGGNRRMLRAKSCRALINHGLAGGARAPAGRGSASADAVDAEVGAHAGCGTGGAHAARKHARGPCTSPPHAEPRVPRATCARWSWASAQPQAQASACGAWSRRAARARARTCAQCRSRPLAVALGRHRRKGLGPLCRRWAAACRAPQQLGQPVVHHCASTLHAHAHTNTRLVPPSRLQDELHQLLLPYGINTQVRPAGRSLHGRHSAQHRQRTRTHARTRTPPRLRSWTATW